MIVIIAVFHRWREKTPRTYMVINHIILLRVLSDKVVLSSD